MSIYAILIIIEILFSITGVVLIFYGLASRKDDIQKLGIVLLIIGVIMCILTYIEYIIMAIYDNTNEVLLESDEPTPTPYEEVINDESTNTDLLWGYYYYMMLWQSNLLG